MPEVDWRNTVDLSSHIHDQVSQISFLKALSCVHGCTWFLFVHFFLLTKFRRNCTTDFPQSLHETLRQYFQLACRSSRWWLLSPFIVNKLLRTDSDQLFPRLFWGKNTEVVSCASTLTVSYYQYHHGDHDPDHDPGQVAQENDEEQAGEHGDNQASAEG